MFFLYNFMQDDSAISSTITTATINGVQINNGIFDHLNLQNILYVSNNVFSTEKPTLWNINTLLNCGFDNTIDAGSISDIIGNVSYIQIQRQEVGTNTWITLQTIYKDADTGVLITNFTMYDTYAKNGTLYLYRILPISNVGAEGTSIEKQILSCFDDAYICDANNIYKITNEYAISGASTIQKSAVYEPYGSTFPFVVKNAVTKYKQASTTAILMATTSTSNYSSYIDRKAQVNLINEFNDWLANGRAKILKDFNGNAILITTYNNISNEYFKELGNGLASTSFDWLQIGEITQTYLNKLGMTEQFNIEYQE